MAAVREHDLTKTKGLGARMKDQEPSTASERLKITLVSNHSYRLGCLQSELRLAGLNAELTLKKPGHTTAAALRRLNPGKTGPELVLLDFTEDDIVARRTLKSIAFGDNRSRAAVAILTLPETEALLDSGEIDGGDATMFSPTKIDFLFGKLSGDEAAKMLKSITVLNEYGPVLIRANMQCCMESMQSA